MAKVVVKWTFLSLESEELNWDDAPKGRLRHHSLPPRTREPSPEPSPVHRQEVCPYDSIQLSKLRAQSFGSNQELQNLPAKPSPGADPSSATQGFPLQGQKSKRRTGRKVREIDEAQSLPVSPVAAMLRNKAAHSFGQLMDEDNFAVTKSLSIDEDGVEEEVSGRDASFSSSHNEMRTTVMLRNIPENYTRMMLVDLLDRYGFAGCYDFLYLPIHFSSRTSFGYAFVNLINSKEPLRFFQTFHGFQDWGVPSDKVAEVTWSWKHQGLGQHIERYRNSPIMHDNMPDEFRPMLLKNGRRIPFPEPTKRIAVPRRSVGVASPQAHYCQTLQMHANVAVSLRRNHDTPVPR